MITGEDIALAARGWVGTPFRHQGRGPGGIDCIGLVARVARDLALVDGDVIDAIERRHSGYGTEPSGGRLQRLLDDYMLPVAPADRQIGDVALMRFVREPQHVAILDRDGGRWLIIHAYQRVGACVRHGLDRAWAARIVRLYRFRGID